MRSPACAPREGSHCALLFPARLAVRGVAALRDGVVQHCGGHLRRRKCALEEKPQDALLGEQLLHNLSPGLLLEASEGDGRELGERGGARFNSAGSMRAARQRCLCLLRDHPRENVFHALAEKELELGPLTRILLQAALQVARRAALDLDESLLPLDRLLQRAACDKRLDPATSGL